MDAEQNRRRELLELCACFAQVVRMLRLPDFELHIAKLYQMLKMLRLIIYTLRMTIIPPPPPVPRYEEVLFEGQQQRRLPGGRDCWTEFVNDGSRFWMLTGETPHSMITIANDLERLLLSRRRHPRRYNKFKLTARNRMLMVFVWLRHYPREELLAAQFGVSINVVSRDIHYIIPILWHYLESQILWPNHQQWTELAGNWENFPNAVGAIDGTVTEINMPLSEPQHEFYSGHAKYHCISTQIIIDNTKRLRFVRSGFLGHCNDAQQYQLLPRIGHDEELHFPENLCLLADSIYPNQYPLLTPFRNNQVYDGLDRQDISLFNLCHRRCRITVEHAISYFKTYAVMKGPYRHERWFLPVISNVCAALAHRRIVVNQQLR